MTTPVDLRRSAYAHWMTSKSIRKTAAALNIPEGTLKTWCREDGWMSLRAAEHDTDTNLLTQDAKLRILTEAYTLVEDLLTLTQDAGKDDRVKLDAIKFALGILGIQPEPPVRATGEAQPPAIPATSSATTTPDDGTTALDRLASLGSASDDTPNDR